MTTALLDSAVERKMAIDQSPRKLFGWTWVRYHDPWINDRLQICRAANCAIGPGDYSCMYVYMCVCSSVCVPERARVYAGDGWTDGQRMEIWVDLNVCMCVRVCTTLPACERPNVRGCNDRF